MNNIFTCVVVDDEPVAREIIESFIQKTPSLSLAASFSNALETIQFAQENEADIYFLDINMPEINGLSLAKIVNSDAHIIFTTAYRDYAIDGFNLNVIDYLLKPIAFDRFLQAIKKIPQKRQTIQKVENKNSNESFLFVRSERKMVKVNYRDIIYIESLSDYLKIHLQEKTIVTRETISNIENKLPEKLFIRVHRSFIVAVHFIDAYTNEFIEINNKAIPISRNYKESTLQKLTGI
ncbi:LytR/AlgR family response regulator transcription factor [Tenacibaculum jejuense]|uniref:Two-component system response regulator, LytR/AlgR family n=1 Tax=Tenacibaculum jejuense TaxID=584609 RepID=A0A238U706_9FLAO|nr:LytTR family DNA-binding domain-containing protein [Tenacibaculum jejuense]SNR14796.1 Two-component system response regulator, LytR/AlgR family [Tenacibaculum jejuense]